MNSSNTTTNTYFSPTPHNNTGEDSPSPNYPLELDTPAAMTSPMKITKYTLKTFRKPI